MPFNLFGATVRRKRVEQEIGLREMAEKNGVSPAYLSNVETDQFAPPAEDRERKIAEILEIDCDELLAMAGKISSDLSEIIREHPRELAALLRHAKGMTAKDAAQLDRLHPARPPRR